MLVPVVTVESVAMAVVHIVDMVTVFDRLVATAGAVLMVAVVAVFGMSATALIPVPVVLAVHMAVVEVVDMIVVRDRSVAAVRPVQMGMVVVDGVGHGHDSASWAWVMASRTM